MKRKTEHSKKNHVLITGISATGKSSVLKELSSRGYKVIDTIPIGSTYQENDSQWGLGFLWDEDEITDLLNENNGQPLFISGTVVNQRRFYDRFDCVILLTAPLDILKGRLEKSKTMNCESIVNFKEKVEPILKEGVDYIIDTDKSLIQLANEIEALLK